jgi:peptide/nickel transport system substrate-binding protein
MEKKNIAITVLIVALLGSGIANIMLVFLGDAELPPDRSTAYIRASPSGPDTLELTDAWDSASNDVLEQIVECLFTWDITDLDLPRVNLLAEDFWWEDTLTLHIKLREGISFHDGTAFNADAAKWNLDRLQFLTNNTGTNTGEVAHTQSLWRFPDGVTSIMNNIASDGLYNITITLNGDYAPFMSTLTYVNAAMISPTFHAADEESFIDLTTGDVCGTGPFVFDSYTPDVDVRLSRWDGYWMRDPHGFPVVANFHTVIFAIYDDAVTAHNAFLNYQVDMNDMASDQNLLQYVADPKLHVEYFTEDTGKPSLTYQYIGFNNKKYNATWRKAFSYAFNYTYILEELRLGNAIRAVSPISPGFGAAFNASVAAVAVPDNGDIAIARATMQSMGFGVGLGIGDDAAWIAVAEGGSPFASPIYTYNTGNTYRTDLGVAITVWLKLIGCAVQDHGIEWSAFLTDLFDQYDNLGIFAIGWMPDYLDPYNMIDPLFNPASYADSGQVNDTVLLDMLDDALAETNTNLRNDIYKKIQWYMATVGYYHAPTYHSKITANHGANIYGVQTNAMGTLKIFPMYRGLYPA